MSNELVGILGLALMVALLMFRTWIGVAMGISGLVGLWIIQGFDQSLFIAGIVPFSATAQYMMAPIPLFILMGVIVAETNMGVDLYNAARAWVGHVKGGLAMASILACALFGAVTGSSSSGAIIMGKIAYPEMKKSGYSDALSTGAIAIAGTLGILIPPSMAFILYGILTEVSVGQLFMAGMIPGIVLTFLLLVVVWVWTKLRPDAGPPGPRSTMGVRIKSLGKIWHVTLLFLLVLGGIYTGAFTPTEAGGIGAIGALIIVSATGQMSKQRFLKIFQEAGQLTAMIMFIVANVFIFMKFMSVSELPFALANFVNGLEVSKWVIFGAIVLLYIVLGCFMPVAPAVILTIPILFPVVMAFHFDPIWFGVVIIVLMELGDVSPPVGMNVFIVGAITGVPVGSIFKGVMLFSVAIIVCTLLLCFFPQLALWLPGMM